MAGAAFQKTWHEVEQRMFRYGTYLLGVRFRCWHLSDGQENDFTANLSPGCVKRVSNRPYACSLLRDINRNEYTTRYGFSQLC